MILPERPWAAKYEFAMKGGDASDSEGTAPDGVIMFIKSNRQEVLIIADSYWNPSSGDESGNELRVEINGEVVVKRYVPVRFDDGESHTIIVSNDPVSNEIAVLHASPADETPILSLSFENPFPVQQELNFGCRPLMEKGSKFTKCELVDLKGL